jgi:hypothetical protein
MVVTNYRVYTQIVINKIKFDWKLLYFDLRHSRSAYGTLSWIPMGKTSSAMAGSEPSRRLHSSLNSHLETELTLLRALIDRSKFQHRSQPFLRKMREVYRLGQRVRDICDSEQLDEIKLKQLLPKVRLTPHPHYFCGWTSLKWKS